MLGIGWDEVRLFVHVLAAAVWVGGQLSLAALVPPLRAVGPDVPRVAARRFATVAWPAFAVLVASGAWNLVAVDVAGTSGRYQVTALVKLLVVFVAGVAAFVHARVESRAAVAAWGAVSGLASVAALLLGVMLHG